MRVDIWDGFKLRQEDADSVEWLADMVAECESHLGQWETLEIGTRDGGDGLELRVVDRSGPAADE